MGLAFGKDNDDTPEPCQHIGDVLISKMIQDYESGKVIEGTFHSDGAKPESGKTLISVFQYFSESWTYPINGHPAKCEFGLILSGDKVVDDVSFKNQLFEAFPRAIGGEMEGRGAYSACRDERLDEWIVVKAICDWGEKKTNPHKEDDQLTASRSVVSLLKHVFSREDAFDKLPEKGGTPKKESEENIKLPHLAPLGYFINIGTTSSRLFEVIDKKTLKEVFVKSYDISDQHDPKYLEGIISHIQKYILPRMEGNSSKLLRKVFVDYNFEEVFDKYEDPSVQKGFVRDFYKQTNLYFNIISKENTVSNLKRLFGGITEKTAIINIGSHSVDILVYSNGKFCMYSLNITLDDIKLFVEQENIQEIWDDHIIDKIKKFILEKIGTDLSNVTVDRAIIIKDELKFMIKMNYGLVMIDGQQLSITHQNYIAKNRELLFNTDYKKNVASLYTDESERNRFYGYKFGHIVIETILDKMENKKVIPKDDLSIHGSINAYIFNVVISGSTHKDGVENIREAREFIERMGAHVLSPSITADGKLAKKITPDTEYEHLKAIDECDVLFICNKNKGERIGKSTSCEIYYAYALRKTIAFWCEPPENKELSFIPREHWGAIKALVI